MADHLSRSQRSLAMSRVRLKDGPLEQMVKAELHSRGLKFECHLADLPGRPDIVFASERLAVFVDGDFWHGWRLPVWEHKLNEFWRAKLRKNKKRDQRNFRKLRAKGWAVIRIWEHQIQEDVGLCISRVIAALDDRAEIVAR